MFFKVVQNKQVHIFNPKERSDYASLQKYIKDVFKKLPAKYQLYYIDEENDQITLANEQDFKIMSETANKTVKIFIKQINVDYYDRTQNIVLDDQPLEEQPLISQQPQSQEKPDFTQIPICQSSLNLISYPVEQKEQKGQIFDELQKIVIQGSSNFDYQKVFIQQSKFKQLHKDQYKNVNPIIIDQNIDEQFNDQSICDSQLSQVSQAMIEQKVSQLMPSIVEKVKAELSKQIIGKSQIKQNKLNKQKKIEQNLFMKKSKPIHKGYTCDNCNKKDIEGIRYKCSVCDNFDICEQCQVNFQHEHCFLKIKRPEQNPLQIFCILNNQEKDSLEMNGKEVPCHNDYNFDLRNLRPFFGHLFRSAKQGFSKQNPYCNKKEERPQRKKEQEVYKQEPKVGQKKVQIERHRNFQRQLEQNNMKNAAYVSQISGIDYNRCYKFAQKNPNLSKEQLLELYLANPLKL